MYLNSFYILTKTHFFPPLSKKKTNQVPLETMSSSSSRASSGGGGRGGRGEGGGDAESSNQLDIIESGMASLAFSPKKRAGKQERGRGGKGGGRGQSASNNGSQSSIGSISPSSSNLDISAEILPSPQSVEMTVKRPGFGR
jgi:hypothetical protein